MALADAGTKNALINEVRSAMNRQWLTWSLWALVVLLPGGLLALPFLLARLRPPPKAARAALLLSTDTTSQR